MHAYQTHLAGLEKAIEAKKCERGLCRFQQTHNMAELINADLTYAVDFNLAHMYHTNKNYKEATDLFTGTGDLMFAAEDH